MPVTTTSPNSELPKATTKGKEAAAHPEQAPALKPSPANATPPTPGTNRRILHDLATTANIPTDRLKTFQLSLIGAETMKRKDLIVGGAFFGPEGIKLGARGKKPLELDDIDPKVVKKAAKEWVQRELSEDQAKRVEKAGILKATRGKKKVATLADEKENEDLAENKDRDGVKKGRKRSSDEAENKDQQPQQQQQEEVTIDWDEEIDEYTWNCDQIRRKIKTCQFYLSSSRPKIPTY
ncbi:hypothetical protein BDZ91DRAFT_11955 [Kalaharituber pfeilii]|nr:hypothetical protein BDZ91DRAFT_11955 [Kalaharituber pfeilii]